jgi:hypothetical protein
MDTTRPTLSVIGGVALIALFNTACAIDAADFESVTAFEPVPTSLQQDWD